MVYVKYSVVHPRYRQRDKQRINMYNIGMYDTIYYEVVMYIIQLYLKTNSFVHDNL